jgi:hypothetical protein
VGIEMGGGVGVVGVFDARRLIARGVPGFDIID